MPRFYFDTHDGEELHADPLGSDFANSRLAHQDAITTLYEMSGRPLSNAARREMWIKVRDEKGKSVAEASVSVGSNAPDLESIPVPAKRQFC